MIYPGSRSLINEHPILVLPSLATKIGLNEAIVSQQLHYWLCSITTSKKKTNYHDGFYWAWNTYDEWQLQFPWWSARTIRRILSSLEACGLVITANYNKLPMDNTKWYRIDYERLRQLTGESKELEHPELQSVHFVQTANTEIEGDESLEPNEIGLDKMDRPPGQNGQTTWTKWTDAPGQVVHTNNQRLTKDFNTETTKQENKIYCDTENFGGLQGQAMYAPEEEFQPNQNSQQVKSSLSTPAQSGNSAKSRTAAKDKGSAAPKNEAKKPKTRSASKYHPGECEALWQKWSALYQEMRGDRDGLQGFVQGFDYLIAQGEPLEDVVEGTEFYIENKKASIAAGKNPISPPDGIRFFKGKKDHPSSYCLDALAYKRERTSTNPQSNSAPQISPEVLAALADFNPNLSPEEAFKHV